jgi:hypothetical protein
VSVPCFLLFLCFRKVTQEIFLELDETKPNLLIFNKASRSLKRRRRGATSRPHHRATWLAPSPRPLWVRPPWPTSDTAPSPIKTPRWEKPKHLINFPETYHPEALPGTLPEREIATTGLLHRHACLRCDE